MDESEFDIINFSELDDLDEASKKESKFLNNVLSIIV